MLLREVAYKHVPMMESCLFVAVENNVLGTANVVAAAAESGIDDFVMISSDKAVHPANLMGLTVFPTRIYRLYSRVFRTPPPRRTCSRQCHVPLEAVGRCTQP
jgi:nucleoside-diphosphate-sugar epimerase